MDYMNWLIIDMMCFIVMFFVMLYICMWLDERFENSKKKEKEDDGGWKNTT